MRRPIKMIKTNQQHEAFYQDMAAALKKYPDMPAEEMLAIASNFLGKLMALQDQRRFTQEDVMDIVIGNIEDGNAQMVSQVTDTKGSA